MKIIDLSVPIISGLPVDPPFQIADIKYVNHFEGLDTMLPFFPGAKNTDLPDGCAWASEFVKMTTHTGTHMDAPYHYHPTMNGGEKAWTIDEVPLEWFLGSGVVVDFSDKPDGYVCKSKDFIEYFEKIGYTLKPADIVLVHTSAMEAWGTPKYLDKGCGVGKEATLWLCAQGIRVVGTNAWSWDAPLSYMGKSYVESGGDCSLIWEGHKAGAEMAYCHMEKLTNLEQLPSFGFTVVAFPVKVEKASAGWCRAVAIIE